MEEVIDTSQFHSVYVMLHPPEHKGLNHTKPVFGFFHSARYTQKRFAEEAIEDRLRAKYEAEFPDFLVRLFTVNL